jgi:hypothetical protein
MAKMKYPREIIEALIIATPSDIIITSRWKFI